MKIEVSEVCKDPHGVMQEISYRHEGRLRREQFVGFDRLHLQKIITERRSELERKRVLNSHASAPVPPQA